MDNLIKDTVGLILSFLDERDIVLVASLVSTQWSLLVETAFHHKLVRAGVTTNPPYTSSRSAHRKVCGTGYLVTTMFRDEWWKQTLTAAKSDSLPIHYEYYGVETYSGLGDYDSYFTVVVDGCTAKVHVCNDNGLTSNSFNNNFVFNSPIEHVSILYNIWYHLQDGSVHVSKPRYIEQAPYFLYFADPIRVNELQGYTSIINVNFSSSKELYSSSWCAIRPDQTITGELTAITDAPNQPLSISRLTIPYVYSKSLPEEKVIFLDIPCCDCTALWYPDHKELRLRAPESNLWFTGTIDSSSSIPRSCHLLSGNDQQCFAALAVTTLPKPALWLNKSPTRDGSDYQRLSGDYYSGRYPDVYLQPIVSQWQLLTLKNEQGNNIDDIVDVFQSCIRVDKDNVNYVCALTANGDLYRLGNGMSISEGNCHWNMDADVVPCTRLIRGVIDVAQNCDSILVSRF